MHGSGFLLYGARSSGKSSFAFQAVLNTVISGGSVVVLCNKEKVQKSSPKPFTRLETLSEEESDRITTIYVLKVSEALTELKALYVESQIPDLVVFDDGDCTIEDTEMDLAECVSFIELMREKLLSEKERELRYIIVTNSLPFYMAEVPFPLSIAPLVQIRFINSKIVVKPLPGDTESETTTILVQWNNGLSF